MIEAYSPYWTIFTSQIQDGISSEGFQLQHIHELGWTEASKYSRLARETIRKDVLAPLAKFGIIPDPERVERILMG